MTISKAVIQKDTRLDHEATQSRQALAEHRWHWTLDESNPKRVSVSEYARAIGRGKTAVAYMVNGYAEWIVQRAPDSEFVDYQARAQMKGETLAAAEAVAEAKGISLDAVRRHHAEEVKDVKFDAADRAERKGTTPVEEVKHVAKAREKVRKSDAETRKAKAKKHTLRFIQTDRRIDAAMRELKRALVESEGVEFDAEERELLGDSLGKLRAVVNLLDVRLVGTTDIDWDAEFEKLGDK